MLSTSLADTPVQSDTGSVFWSAFGRSVSPDSRQVGSRFELTLVAAPTVCETVK